MSDPRPLSANLQSFIESSDYATARANLGLGDSDNVVFGSQVTAGMGMIRDYGGGQLGIGGTGGNIIYVAIAGLFLNRPLYWHPQFGTAHDLALHRDAAATLAQKDGSNAQTFRVYGTYTSGSGTDASNDIVGEWLSVGFNGSQFEISSKFGSSGGTRRDLRFAGGGNSFFQISSLFGLFQANTTAYFWESSRMRTTVGGVADLGGSSTPWKDIYLRPSSSLTPAANGDLTIEATDDTTLTFKLKGSDGVVRSGAINLA